MSGCRIISGSCPQGDDSPRTAGYRKTSGKGRTSGPAVVDEERPGHPLPLEFEPVGGQVLQAVRGGQRRSNHLVGALRQGGGVRRIGHRRPVGSHGVFGLRQSRDVLGEKRIGGIDFGTHGSGHGIDVEPPRGGDPFRKPRFGTAIDGIVPVRQNPDLGGLPDIQHPGPRQPSQPQPRPDVHVPHGQTVVDAVEHRDGEKLGCRRHGRDGTADRSDGAARPPNPLGRKEIDGAETLRRS